MDLHRSQKSSDVLGKTKGGMASPAQSLFGSKKKLSYPEAGPDSSSKVLDSSDHSTCLRTPQKAAEGRARRVSLRFLDNAKSARDDHCDPECRSSKKVGENESAAKLPEKYESLCERFSSLVSAVRLLRLKGHSATFANICASVQVLTNKEFSSRHLAKLKFLMPEAIEISKALLHDKKTCCMKPEILIQLKPEALNLNGDKYLALREALRARVLAFVESNREDAEIPETLPDIFRELHETCHDATVPESKFNGDPDHGVNLSSSRLDDGSTTENVSPPPLGTFLSRFKRRFTHKAPLPESKKTQLLSLTTIQEVSLSDWPCQITSASQANPSTEDLPCSVKMDFMEPQISSFGSSIESTPTKASVLGKELLSTPLAYSKADAKIKNDLYCSKEGLEISETPTLQPDSTPAKLMSSTPSLFTPKRARRTPEGNPTLHTRGQRRATKPKALNFLSPIKSVEKGNGKRKLSADEEIVRTRPRKLQKTLEEKEKKMMVECEGNAHKKMINCLPRLFDMIYLIAQAAGCSVISKQELIYKIMTKDLGIVDREILHETQFLKAPPMRLSFENCLDFIALVCNKLIKSIPLGKIEEQLKLLQQMIPDWISEKALGGDFVFCISKKISDPESLRARLMMAGEADALSRIRP